MNLNLNTGPVPTDLPPQASSGMIVLALLAVLGVSAVVSVVAYAVTYVALTLDHRRNGGAR
jgi:hypothetical protein